MLLTLILYRTFGFLSSISIAHYLLKNWCAISWSDGVYLLPIGVSKKLKAGIRSYTKRHVSRLAATTTSKLTSKLASCLSKESSNSKVLDISVILGAHTNHYSSSSPLPLWA